MLMLKDRLIFVSLLIAASLNIILWLILAGKFGGGQEKIPLHFSVVYGIDLLGPARQIFVIPLTGVMILAVNAVLAHALYTREKLFSYFLSFSATAVQIILMVAVAVLMVLNAS